MDRYQKQENNMHQKQQDNYQQQDNKNQRKQENNHSQKQQENNLHQKQESPPKDEITTYLENLTNAELKQISTQYNIPFSFNKNELINRIKSTCGDDIISLIRSNGF